MRQDIYISEPLTLTVPYGPVQFHYIQGSDESSAIAIRCIDDFQEPVPLRIQSSCVFSQVFHADSCDCAQQLRAALEIISTASGLLIYAFEEGRGAGLEAKMRAMRLQQNVYCDTISAYRSLGLKPDLRNHHLAAQAARQLLGVRQVEALTHNRHKLTALSKAGLNVVAHRNLLGTVDSGNTTGWRYLSW